MSRLFYHIAQDNAGNLALRRLGHHAPGWLRHAGDHLR